jgi:enamine deaminase RidA (YjgF/YER057c/UK114 family)
VGKVGVEVSDEEAYLSSRDALLNCLACVKLVAGNLDNVQRIVKITGFVNCIGGYAKQPSAINGASDLLEKLYGENGKHARSAIGVSSLPSNVSVELELIAELKKGV